MGMMPSMMSQMFGGFDSSNMGMNMNAMNMGMGMNAQNQFGGPWMSGQDSYNNNAFGNGGYGNQGGYKMTGNYNNMNDQSYANNDFRRGYGRQGFQGRRGRRGYYNGGFGRNNYNQAPQGNQYGYANQNASMQQTYPQSQSEPLSNANDDTAQEQHTRNMVTAEESEAQMLKELAPGGQHDFDEELGRKPSVDETPLLAVEQSENADHSTSSDSKETLPTEPTVEENSQPNDRIEKGDIHEEQTAGESASYLNDHAAPVVSAETASISAMPAEDAVEGDAGSAEDEAADSAPQPIQTFISDEPRSRNAMLPPAANLSVGSASQHVKDVHGPGRGGQMSSYPAQGNEVSTVESRGVGVVGAPTGPRALRQGLPNTGRSGWDRAAPKPSFPTPIENDERGQSRRLVA